MCNCINADLQAENKGLRLQLAAATQALETQNRENHPYTKELEAKLKSAELIIESTVINYEANPGGITPDIIEKARDFIAGTEWAELSWIPVTERLPEDNGRYFCVTAADTWIVGEYEHNYIFCDPSGCSWRCKLWCPIPDSLLNFKP